MAAIEWDKVGERYYETGTDHGVLYLYNTTSNKYDKGVAWNGLTGVTSSPSGAEPSPMYADNIKYVNMLSAEEFGGTIEAYTYPEEFERCDGSYTEGGVSFGQQKREQFGFSWRTLIGNDTEGNEKGYKIHIAYGAQAQPSEKAYTTVNDSPEAVTLSWTFTTTAVAFDDAAGLKPTAYVVLDSRRVDPQKLKAVTDVLYGVGSDGPRLPDPNELMTILGLTGPQGSTGGSSDEDPTP